MIQEKNKNKDNANAKLSHLKLIYSAPTLTLVSGGNQKPPAHCVECGNEKFQLRTRSYVCTKCGQNYALHI